MYNAEKPYYMRIVKYLRQILPFFDDFELYEEFGNILLRWKEKGTNKIFNAGQASDGMLRTIALVSLLAQNPKDLPTVLFLDEPELGLHPSAIDTISGLIKAASEGTPNTIDQTQKTYKHISTNFPPDRFGRKIL